jgi:predicted RNase H-like HicB family nuclease
MPKYKIVIFWSDEDDLYVTYAPELPGCMAHGDTYEEALKSIMEAMDLWLEVAREFGDRVPQPKIRQIAFEYAAPTSELPAAASA